MKLKVMAAVGLLTVAGPMRCATADDGAALYAAKLCNTCHGADAQTPIMPTYPKLGGQNAEYAAQQIKDIRDGTRTNGLSMAMKPLVATLTDEEITTISEWLATIQ